MGTAVIRHAEPGRSIAIDSPIAQILAKPNAQAAIMPYLTRGVKLEQIIAEVWHAAEKNPEILKCDEDSIIHAVSQAVASGLVIGEETHLVPFGKKLTVIRDYRGDIALVLRAGAARYIDAQCVYSNEKFEYEQGTSPFIRHRPIIDQKARGTLIGAYGIAKVSHEDVKIVHMSVEEIDAIRKAKSKSWKNGPLSDIPWYARKTMVHQVCKQLPKHGKVGEVLAAFEREEAEIAAAEVIDVSGMEEVQEERSEALAPSRQIATSATSVGNGDGVAAPPAASSEPAAAAPAIDPDLERAMLLPLAGQKTSWRLKINGVEVPHGGKPIGECPTSVLKQARHFFTDLKAQKPGEAWIGEQLAAITRVLDDRDQDQGTIDFPATVDEPPAATAAPAPETSVRAKGRVEDAIRPDPAKGDRAAQQLGMFDGARD